MTIAAGIAATATAASVATAVIPLTLSPGLAAMPAGSGMDGMAAAGGSGYGANGESPNDGAANYVPTLLHRSTKLGDGHLLLRPWRTGTPPPVNPKPDPAQPRVLFFNLFPLHSNGSGMTATALMREIDDQGGEARVLSIGHGHGNPPGLRKYVLPFENANYGAEKTLDGAARAGAPFFDANTAVTGKPFREMERAEILAYTDALTSALAAAVGDFQPDVVVVNHGWLGAEAARRVGVPYMVYLHGTDTSALGKINRPGSTYPRLFADLAIPATQQARLVVGVSHHTREAAIPLYQLAWSQTEVIYNGYDKDIFARDPSISRQGMLEYFGIPHHGVTHVVAYAGRMATIKGPDVLIDAAKEVVQHYPGVRFLLAGNGQYLGNYVDVVAKHGLEDHVHFLDHRRPEEVNRLFNGADVVAVPSRSEAFGIVAAEAAATGTPVVASSVGGLSEVVRGSFGRLVESGRPDLLAEQLVDVLQAGVKLLVGESLASMAQTQFTWESSGQKFMAAIRGVMTQSQ